MHFDADLCSFVLFYFYLCMYVDFHACYYYYYYHYYYYYYHYHYYYYYYSYYYYDHWLLTSGC